MVFDVINAALLIGSLGLLRAIQQADLCPMGCCGQTFACLACPVARNKFYGRDCLRESSLHNLSGSDVALAKQHWFSIVLA